MPRCSGALDDPPAAGVEAGGAFGWRAAGSGRRAFSAGGWFGTQPVVTGAVVVATVVKPHSIAAWAARPCASPFRKRCGRTSTTGCPQVTTAAPARASLTWCVVTRRSRPSNRSLRLSQRVWPADPAGAAPRRTRRNCWPSFAVRSIEASGIASASAARPARRGLRRPQGRWRPCCGAAGQGHHHHALSDRTRPRPQLADPRNAHGHCSASDLERDEISAALALGRAQRPPGCDQTAGRAPTPCSCLG